MTYYSPDAILTDSQKAPCTFELAVPLLAPLNNGAAIEPGSKLELPLWLAEMLAVSRPAGPSSAALATIDMPGPLGQRVMNALSADPRSVDVRAQAQWFYGMGERMLELFDDEDVAEILSDTFKKRALEIADKAQNSSHVQQGGGGNRFMESLDESERQLFRAAHDGSKAAKDWFRDATTKP